MNREVLVKITACDPGHALACSECGAVGQASCGCNAPYVRVAAALADEKNRHRSNRAIAKDIGVGEATVRRSRGAPCGAPEKRTGRDGKSYPARKMPKRKAEPPLIHEECEECSTDEQRWQQSCAGMLGEMLSLAPYWRKEFGKWERFHVTSALVKLAAQAADELSSLAEQIKSQEISK